LQTARLGGSELPGGVQGIEPRQVEQHDLHTKGGGSQQLQQRAFLSLCGAPVRRVAQQVSAVAQPIQVLQEGRRVRMARVVLKAAPLGGKADVSASDARPMAEEIFGGYGTAGTEHALQRKVGRLPWFQDQLGECWPFGLE
jgi:hypothetical protein